MRSSAGVARAVGIMVVGSALLAYVAANTLVRANYRDDIDTICHAEARSGRSLDWNMGEVRRWTRGHLTTPEGNELLSWLGSAPIADRADRLRHEAEAHQIADCPTAASFERLVLSGEHRADLLRLCSRDTFPDLVMGSDPDRMAALDAWADDEASSPRTRDLVRQLDDAPAGDRGRRLRAAAHDAGVFSCAIARVLDTPRPDEDASDSGADGGP